MKKHLLLRASKGTGSDKNAASASEPQNNEDIDNEVDMSETTEGKIPSGVRLSNLITDYIAWKGINNEYKAYFYSIGARKKKELYAISQAIRCRQEPSTRAPPRFVPNV